MKYNIGDKVIYIYNKPGNRTLLKRPVGIITSGYDPDDDNTIGCSWDLGNGKTLKYSVYEKNIKLFRGNK